MRSYTVQNLQFLAFQMSRKAAKKCLKKSHPLCGDVVGSGEWASFLIVGRGETCPFDD